MDGETHPGVDAPIKFLGRDGAGIYFPRHRQLVKGWIAGMGQDQTGSMQVHLNRHLMVRWEHGGKDESTDPYRSTMLWYGTPAQTALPGDDVLPAVPASRLAHHYAATGQHT